MSSEKPCGQTHRSIIDARSCAHKLRHPSSAEFGDLTTGVNLWWGVKRTAKLRNAGLVIGLKNDSAGIGWRLDYDTTKGIHLNQFNKNGGLWEDVWHPIQIATADPEGFVFNTWAAWTKLNERLIPANVAEVIGSGTIEDYRSLRRGN